MATRHHLHLSKTVIRVSATCCVPAAALLFPCCCYGARSQS